MATDVISRKITHKTLNTKGSAAKAKAAPAQRDAASPPKAVAQRAEALLGANYAYMDSPVFRQRGIEKELFTFEEQHEPELPMTSWYQPTRDDLDAHNSGHTPQLMSAADYEKYAGAEH